MKIKIQANQNESLNRCSVKALQRNGAFHAFTFQRFHASTLCRAFTLVEMLLVVTIIGILAALVIPRIAGTSERARKQAVFADINGGIKSALGAYEVDMGYYPKSLQELLTPPSNAKNWHGPYLERLPIDPWGNPYVYYYPGKHNSAGYDLLSVGPDAKEGTDDDLGNWMN
jgi:general secretion pathway protein G